MNGLIFDADTCEMVLPPPPVIQREPDYIRVSEMPPIPPRNTARAIVSAVAAYYGLTVAELCGASHAHRIVHPRQLGMYLCRKLTKLSFAQITAAFGRSDHTTAINACKVVESRLGFCPKTIEAYRVLVEQMGSA